jgi:hypothetical protein
MLEPCYIKSLMVNPALKLVIFKLNPGVTDKIFFSTLEATTKT